MDDSVREEGVEHQFSQTVEMEPSKILLVEFESDGGFVVR